MGEEHADVPMWKVHGERTLYEHHWVRLDQVDVEPPGGDRWWHHVVRLRPIAASVVLDDDRVLMLYRHRFVPGTVAWELPGGVIDDGESGADTAARETEEETGWRPDGPMELLVTFEPMPGMVAARHEVYLARAASRVGQPTDVEESGRIEWIPLQDIPAMVAGGRIAGGGSLVGLLYLLASRRVER